MMTILFQFGVNGFKNAFYMDNIFFGKKPFSMKNKINKNAIRLAVKPGLIKMF